MTYTNYKKGQDEGSTIEQIQNRKLQVNTEKLAPMDFLNSKFKVSMAGIHDPTEELPEMQDDQPDNQNPLLEESQ